MNPRHDSSGTSPKAASQAEAPDQSPASIFEKLWRDNATSEEQS